MLLKKTQSEPPQSFLFTLYVTKDIIFAVGQRPNSMCRSDLHCSSAYRCDSCQIKWSLKNQSFSKGNPTETRMWWLSPCPDTSWVYMWNPLPPGHFSRGNSHKGLLGSEENWRLLVIVRSRKFGRSQVLYILFHKYFALRTEQSMPKLT